MNTSPQTSLITGLLSDEPLGPEHLGYLHARIQNKAHDCVLRVFLDESVLHGINKAHIARRLGKRPEVIGRCLTAPGNWTLATVAELLGSMGYDVEIRAQSFHQPQLSNNIHDIAIYRPSDGTTSSGAPTTITYVGDQSQPVPIFIYTNGMKIGSTI